MATAKQEAAIKVRDLYTANPTLSVTELCKEHGVSPGYYYNYAAKKKKRKTPTSVPAELAKPFTLPATQEQPMLGSGLARTAVVVFLPTTDLSSIIRQTFGGVQ